MYKHPSSMTPLELAEYMAKGPLERSDVRSWRLSVIWKQLPKAARHDWMDAVEALDRARASNDMAEAVLERIVARNHMQRR